MDSLIMLSDPARIVAEDVCFSAMEYAALVARVNADAQTTMTYGLIIGAMAGAAGLYFGKRWYDGRNKK